jgi:hypothetical protein
MFTNLWPRSIYTGFQGGQTAKTSSRQKAWISSDNLGRLRAALFFGSMPGSSDGFTEFRVSFLEGLRTLSQSVGTSAAPLATPAFIPICDARLGPY